MIEEVSASGKALPRAAVVLCTMRADRLAGIDVVYLLSQDRNPRSLGIGCKVAVAFNSGVTTGMSELCQTGICCW